MKQKEMQGEKQIEGVLWNQKIISNPIGNREIKCIEITELTNWSTTNNTKSSVSAFMCNQR